MSGATFAAWVTGAVLLTGALSGVLSPVWGHLATVLLLAARIESRSPHV